MKETDLYPPIKRLLEQQGFEVKAEVNSCDVMAVRSNEPPVIVELKLGLTLQVIYQAIDRLALSETVYIAIAKPKRVVPAEAVKLCRRIGVGLMVVAKSGSVDVVAEPIPYAPRPNTKRKNALMKEFRARKGDANIGGSAKQKLMTAYKQDALRCLRFMASKGPSTAAIIRKSTQVERCASILRNDYYGWFSKVQRGTYTVTETGKAAAQSFASIMATL